MGVASKLMAHTRLCKRNGYIAYGGVCYYGREQMSALHERFGFTYCGLTPQVGFKHGKISGYRNMCIIGIIKRRY